MNVTIKPATRSDTGAILDLIKGIAKYEKLSNQVVADEALLEQQLFDEVNAYVLLAYVNDTAVGFALYFYNFSTFKGKKGLYLEDLFIREEYRKKGIGEKLFDELKRIAKTNNCGRIEWVCLDWNEPAKTFYRKKKATPMEDWIIFRLDERDL